MRIESGICSYTSKIQLKCKCSGCTINHAIPLATYVDYNGPFLLYVSLFYERPVQFRFNRLIINKVMLVSFLDDFVTVLFCIALIWSVSFWSFNLLRLMNHSYQSNKDSMLCFSHQFGVQNGPLQAEVLI